MEKDKIKSVIKFFSTPILLLVAFLAVLLFIPGDIPILLIRIVAALWFLSWYRKILIFYEKLFEPPLESEGSSAAGAITIKIMQPFINAAQNIVSRFRGKDSEIGEVFLPDEFHKLLRKVNISRHSRKYFYSWLVNEGTADWIRHRVLTGEEEDGEVSYEEIKEAFYLHYSSSKE